MTGVTLADIVFLIIIVFLVITVWHVVSGEFWRGAAHDEEYKRILQENRKLKWENAQLRAELDYPKNPKVSVTYKGRWDE